MSEQASFPRYNKEENRVKNGHKPLLNCSGQTATVGTLASAKVCLALIVMVYFAGCGGAGINGTAPRVYENAKEMVKEARAGITEISIEEFKVKMESDEPFVLIDVREPGKYDENNIPGSISIPRGLLEFKIADEKFWDDEGMYVPGKDEEIIVYCKKGERGALAAETLVKLGYTNVKNLIGGWVVWEGGPEALEEEEEEVEESGCG